MRFLKHLAILPDLLISPCFFVILVDLLIPIFFKGHTPQSWHCLLLYLLNTTQLLPKSSPLDFHPSHSSAMSPTPFPIVIGQRTKGFYFRWLTSLKLSEISLNFNGEKTPTTGPKVANFFTKIKL